jgi:GrpB-like predicted nucleotidyltransferase (UPF0157 family)
MQGETLKEKIARVVKEHVSVVEYDPRWPELFENEKERLLDLFPEIIRRVEHFGSTAVPGLPAKPIVDLLVEVGSLDDAKEKIAPVLESLGYDYFWRPSWGDDVPPYYAWFIKRDSEGKRTHHIHMVEAGFEHWERLLFRDYLRAFPELAKEYADLKLALSEKYSDDRIAYTKAKTDFILRTTSAAKEYYGKTQ